MLIEFGTPIWFPLSWFLETSNILLLGVVNLLNWTPQKYLGLAFEPKNWPFS
jgi:hypothetical protein